MDRAGVKPNSVRRRRKKKSKLRVLLSRLSLALLLVLIVASYVTLKNPRTLPVKHVVIDASYQHITPQKLQKILAPYAVGGLFTINVEKLRAQTDKLPWVKDLEIKRVWPDKIVVKVVEQKAIATWNDDALLNSEGDVFHPNKVSFPKGLPLLHGPDDQAADMLQFMQQMDKKLQNLGLTITQMTLSPRRSWRIMLNNGMMLILGKTNINKRLQLFVKVYPHIIGNQGQKVQTVDLRYQDGLAMKWR